MARRDYIERGSEPPRSLERSVGKYVISALSGVIAAGIIAGPPLYARFVSMEDKLGDLVKSVEKLTTQVMQLKIEVTELQTTNNVLNIELKDRLNGSTKD